MIKISFYYCKWMVGKHHNWIKQHYLRNRKILLMEDITDADYGHAKRVCKDCEMKKLGEYQDLYDQSNTLLLADVFETLEILVLKYTDLILQNIFQLLD